MATLDNRAVEAAYARWAPIYDMIFNVVMRPGRQAAAAAADCPGGQVLIAGVGTGLELPYFSRETTLFGIDLSVPMLRAAQRRVAANALAQVRGLMAMDAARLGFPDATFDKVVAPYVITVVPDPQATLDELARVVKPGGEIVLVNHVAAESGPRAGFETWLGKFGARLGWRPEFPFAVVGDWIERHPEMTLLERRALPPLDLFTLVRIGRRLS